MEPIAPPKKGELSAGFERLFVPDAELYYRERLDLGCDPLVLMQRLIDGIAWRAETIVLWGKRMPQPRLIAWYGDAGVRYTYSRNCLRAVPWTPELLGLRSIVAQASGAAFNGVLLNYYRNHRDSMGYHSDDEAELGRRPVIASLSLGEERVLVMKHKYDKTLEPLRIPMASGSLLIMKGETQRFWRHGILKQTRPCGPRVNLTFRQVEE